ncbi:MAG: hypothetical protein ACWA6U_08050 [Breznakibacter sp.]
MSSEIIYAGIQAFNKDVREWGQKVERILKTKVRTLKSGTKDTNPGEKSLADAITLRTRSDSGEITSLSYHFPRKGVFFYKGVGRGHVMVNGTVARGKRVGKVVKLTGGPVNRQPWDWFNEPIEKEFNELADIIASHKADEVMADFNRMRMD